MCKGFLGRAWLLGLSSIFLLPLSLLPHPSLRIFSLYLTLDLEILYTNSFHHFSSSIKPSSSSLDHKMMTPLTTTIPNNNNINSQFGDTTYTKVFVGGLAWETQKDTMKQYFEQFGDILEAVVISDKSTGRSKGYGFVTFREAESAMKACVDPAPVIDGRRANCNLAAFGAQKSKPSSTSKQAEAGVGGSNMSSTRVMTTKPFQKAGVGMGAAFAYATTFPHYAIQQGIPYNVFGYSHDYAYPTNYYGVYGGSMGGQYPMYGTATADGGMVAASAGATAAVTPYYPYVQYATGGGGYGQYPYHAYQPNHHQHMVQYSTAGSTYPYQAYGPSISMAPSRAIPSGLNMMALPAPIPHH